ncbi:MAG: glutathione S-transferase family protein [Tropicimonas sp.]|uniref:glutathione S-transferase family protein n=1 Tax=Tropicimonas sp. TaxID=2067044 RepID=UPI003A8ABEC9
MLTRDHSPMSRSTSVMQLSDERGAADRVKVVEVTIRRQDGSGGPDPRNAHPEKKVPYLTDGDDHVRERAAVVLYLTDRFPGAGFGRAVGDPQRGQYLSWLIWYQGVFEPVTMLNWAEIDHPALKASLGDYQTGLGKLDETLARQPYLLGDKFSAADLLCSGPFQWFGEAMPMTPAVAAWVKRCAEQPSNARAMQRDQAKAAG